MSDLQHDRIGTLARELRLNAIGDLYGSIAQAAVKRDDATYADFLEEVLRAERDARRVRSAEMLARTAGFPAIKTLEDYDFAFATGAPKAQIQELASLAFVQHQYDRFQRVDSRFLLGVGARWDLLRAETELKRVEKASRSRAVSEMDVDRARADLAKRLDMDVGEIAVLEVEYELELKDSLFTLSNLRNPRD